MEATTLLCCLKGHNKATTLLICVTKVLFKVLNELQKSSLNATKHLHFLQYLSI